MRVVIDLQGAQTASRYRGIGRYSMSLTKALLSIAGHHEIHIMLSAHFPESVEAIRSELCGHLPQHHIHQWCSPGPVSFHLSDNTQRRKNATYIREAAIAALKPDRVLITSLFEGCYDDAVVSLKQHDPSTPVAVVLYDLIPLLNPDTYLQDHRYREFYQNAIKQLKKADAHLAISQHSAQEGLDALTLPQSSISIIGTACDSHFAPRSIPNHQAQIFLSSFGITGKFVMYTGGTDNRKNLARLIQAYAGIPATIRQQHQLVFVGKLSPEQSRQLKHQARQSGLDETETVITGYVDDQQLACLYNLCAVFVFPSWHEGFGLPVLEAMASGAPALASDRTSLPEVLANPHAMFDPFDTDQIRQRIQQALTDHDYCRQLIATGLKQARKFSWKQTAQKALVALEQAAQHPEIVQTRPARQHKPTMAFLSPLPPQKSGIADHSAILLPALSEYYQIEIFSDQEFMENSWIAQHLKHRKLQEFPGTAHTYERILYQFGNSAYHDYMFSLLQQHPGTVVLHDAFLSGILEHMEKNTAEPHFSRQLYYDHGYLALQQKYRGDSGTEQAIKNYPCSLHVLRRSHGVIVHSEHSKAVLENAYGPQVSDVIAFAPLPRATPHALSSQQARQQLGIDPQAFMVCSFGHIAPTKLSHLICQAWTHSRLSNNPNMQLVFVGASDPRDPYSHIMKKSIQSVTNVKCTQWVDESTYHLWLAAADIAVQLRTDSRGETSAAILDCLNYAIPTIVNAHGYLAELPEDTVFRLPDIIEPQQLARAIETLQSNEPLRGEIGKRAVKYVQDRHQPCHSASHYTHHIESFHNQAMRTAHGLIRTLATDTANHDQSCLRELAQAIGKSIPAPARQQQLLVDVTATSTNDLRTGIERVTRALFLALLQAPPQGYRIEPVCLVERNQRWSYYYARNYTCTLLGIPTHILTEEPLEVWPGDHFLSTELALHQTLSAYRHNLYTALANQGVTIHFMVHDLLPLSHPEYFPPGADQPFAQWLQVLTEVAHNIICVSNAVAQQLQEWYKQHPANRRQPLTIQHSHHGADISQSAPTTGIPEEASSILQHMRQRPTFLMVGTIEPRKGYLQVLHAFDILWRNKVNVNLVIVGREGWQGLPDEARRDIPRTIQYMQNHPELDSRLFWLEGISDQYLEKVYTASTSLIAASYGEGFGLPLIEAAQHSLPIIARDIPVFREVAREHAWYFQAHNPEQLAHAITNWLELYRSEQHPASQNLPWLTWQESAQNLWGKLTKPGVP
ncbi:glycosyl transferase group 1 [Desulfurispirillum indicum S5]|uniref:Glycosyl transferase group 1 n=1 Tax=Desulfurispirillum indicum (strain ATCC BAA-1389 / DSM 22839 / S5) TaxID=653733 RepID=E6W643_DESIS|nr:glycosyltransferase [Desulfurispirillum indicum]ADU64982.1 glycosyl transferase group 1 [Desulfurispirillum indicum S5]